MMLWRKITSLTMTQYQAAVPEFRTVKTIGWPFCD